MALPSAPTGYNTITPRVFVDDVEGLVGFLQHVFGGTNRARPGAPAEIAIGDSLLMVSSTEIRAPMPAFLYVYVADVDTAYRRALEQGATSLEDPRNLPYGDRRAMVQDPWGNIWQIAARL